MDKSCMSFDYEYPLCYLSDTNQYQHPEAFVVYPLGDYYEWTGTASEPIFYPNGGWFSTTVSANIVSSSRKVSIHYRIVNGTDSSILLDDGILQSGEGIVLPQVPCKIEAYTTADGLDKSAVFTSKLFEIHGNCCFKF